MPTVDLVCLSEAALTPPWGLGGVFAVRPEPESVAKAVEQLTGTSTAAAVLFWDASFGTPDQELVQKLISLPVDCWHAGLKLGMNGLPGIIRFVSPTWMLTCDPSRNIQATSWRLSLRVCLVRTEVLRSLGGPRPEFQSLDGAGLELGHRWIRRGALMRHVPRLLGEGGIEDGRSKIEDRVGLEDGRSKMADGVGVQSPISQLPSPICLPFEDELRFVYYRHGRKWAAWAVFRALMTSYTTLPTALRSWRKVMSSSRPPEPAPYRISFEEDRRSKMEDCVGLEDGRSEFEDGRSKIEDRGLPSSISDLPSPISHLSALNPQPASVSVLIPTLNRYSYLRTLLGQLRQQTVEPLEIIIIDQTAADRRQEGLYEGFSDLPLRVIYQDEPGQCTARNAGLQTARGDYILFIDDDDEVKPDLIESHVRTLAQFGAEVSSGVADEVGAGPLPADFCLLRASDVFPTNNTLVRREVLTRSGLFDLAYNRGQNEDGDLGMRVYLSGALMVLNPDISVLHHHAPVGGLRSHKARTVTYAASRNNVASRALASASEIYLAQRYFSRSHMQEMLWQNVLGTFSVRGSRLKRAVKVAVSGLLLPQSIWELMERLTRANEMSTIIPRIAILPRDGKLLHG